MTLGTAMAPYELRFDAGRICLDLLTTAHPAERLDSAAVLRAWIDGVGLVPSGTPLGHVDASWLPDFRELRGHLALLTRDALPAGTPPTPAASPSPPSPPYTVAVALARVNAAARAAPPAPRAVRVEDGSLVRELAERPARAALLAAVARDAVELLTDPAARTRLRQCAGDGCPIVYLDTSRGLRRRWCSSETCGNRVRVARHRRRTRVGRRATP